MPDLVEFPCVFSAADMPWLHVAVDNHGQQFLLLSFASVFSSGLCFANRIIGEGLNFANNKRYKIIDHIIYYHIVHNVSFVMTLYQNTYIKESFLIKRENSKSTILQEKPLSSTHVEEFFFHFFLGKVHPKVYIAEILGSVIFWNYELPLFTLCRNFCHRISL